MYKKDQSGIPLILLILILGGIGLYVTEDTTASSFSTKNDRDFVQVNETLLVSKMNVSAIERIEPLGARILVDETFLYINDVSFEEVCRVLEIRNYADLEKE